MTDNAVMSDVDAFMYVVLSKEKIAFWGISLYRWMYDVIDEVLHKPRSF
jgi:hypothetical protein